MVDWAKLDELGDWLKSQDDRIEKVTFHGKDDWEGDPDKIWVRIRGKTPEVPGRTFQYDYLIPPMISDLVDWRGALLQDFWRELGNLVDEYIASRD